MKNGKRKGIICGTFIAGTVMLGMLFARSGLSDTVRADVGTEAEFITADVETMPDNRVVNMAQLERESELQEKYIEIENEMLLGEDSDENAVYKDCYAGAYIAEGKLVVCITDEAEMKENTADVEYRLIKYTYNELSELSDKFVDIYTEACNTYPEGTMEHDLLISIEGWGVDEETNAIEVDIVDGNKEKEKMFKKLFGDYDCVHINFY